MTAQIAEVGSFWVPTGGRWTTDGLLRETGYAEVSPAINSYNFPSGELMPEEEAEIVLLQFPPGMGFREMIKAARESGCERPTYQHPLRFGKHNPYEHKAGPIVFPHETTGKVMVLWGVRGGCGLDLIEAEPVRAEYRYAFVRMVNERAK